MGWSGGGARRSSPSWLACTSSTHATASAVRSKTVSRTSPPTAARAPASPPGTLLTLSPPFPS
eukprot:CAMPEP_0181384008 /NCGR_PEP_ID=MMETSP1106-20121128/21709_1 /TAXON_ID=81844 /ORGANISM="Mantoniella antarctica, Strain SL-175" /LENGTH=62 /DNA_ID=CAMNT_0023503797 /DNA_START=278 /DNA_END=462 /DNA_ORIENTATION=-